MNLTPIDAVRCYYRSLTPGRRADLMELLDSRLVLEVPDGFPGGGGTYVGLKAYLEDFLYNFYGTFDLETAPSEFLDAGDTVVALGHHRGHALSTGIAVDVPFAHVWTVHEGRLVRGRMFTDTATLCIAAGARSGPVTRTP